MIRFLFLFAALLATVAAPFGMAGPAAAMPPGGMGGMTMSAGHCEGMMPAPVKDDQDTPSIDCLLACSALPATAPDAPAGVVAEISTPGPPPLFSLAGMKPEAETPPPRRS